MTPKMTIQTRAQPDQKAPDSLTQRSFPQRFSRRRKRLATSLLRLAEAADTHPWLVLAGVLVIAVPVILGQSLDRPLWHDELFTYAISQQPTLAQLLRVNWQIDLVPPLSFLLTRTSYHILGVNTLTTRLPEMAGFLLAMVSLFLFVRRRYGGLYGVLASTLFFTGAALPQASEARPYGLLLGLGALGLLAWQIARENGRFGTPLLLISGFGILLDHVFGAFVWLALAVAEAVRIFERRRVDWKLFAAWAVPLVSIVTWIPLLRTHSQAIFPSQFQPALHSMFGFYDSEAFVNALPVLCTAFLMLLLLGRRSLQGSKTWGFSRYEWVAIFGILLVPALIIVQLSRSHAAFFPRYGVASAIAIAALGSALLAFWTNADLRAALFCIVIALGIPKEFRYAAKAILHQHAFTRAEPVVLPCGPCTASANLDASLPLVDASGLAFVEMSHREDARTLARVYYLTDPIASAKYAHANIFEGMQLEKQLLPLRGNVSTYTEFTREHHHFFVFGDYGYPEDWLLRKLMDDGARLRFVGRYESSYESHDLYEVTIQ